MGKQSNRKQEVPQTASEAHTKGKLVEFIVASMHDASGVKIERNVRLPARRSKNRRYREVDVLMTTEVAGYPVRMAIECKNYKETVGVNLVDEFIGKLNDVGIPLQHGIYVTARRFTKDARNRAEEEGLRLLLLTGLTQDRMAAEVSAALQTLLFLLPQLVAVTAQPDQQEARPMESLEDTIPMGFCDEQGRLCADMPDAIWSLWLDGLLPLEVGTYKITLQAPHWHRVQGGVIMPVSTVVAFVAIAGLVVSLGGESSQHTLVNVEGDKVEKVQVNASFAPSEGKHTVRTFETEADLQTYLESRPEPVKINSRIKLPRIWFDSFYWPPSERAEEYLTQRDQGGLYPEDRTEIEGTDLQRAWEPISPRYWPTSDQSKASLMPGNAGLRVTVEPTDALEVDPETGFPRQRTPQPSDAVHDSNT